MVDIITTDDLAAYLEPLTVSGTRADKIVELTNGLITLKWQNPVDPAPVNVENLALTVAERAFTHAPGRAPLESETVAFDDSSRTRRYAVTAEEAGHAGVYLTETELADLNGDPTTPAKRAKSVSMAVPGVCKPSNQFVEVRGW